MSRAAEDARARLIATGQWERELEARAEIARRVGLHEEATAGRAPLAVKAGNVLIPYTAIKHVLIDNIENEQAVIVTTDGYHYLAEGFDAIEAVMLLKPSALEGRRLKWNKGAWAFHNMVGHPVMQILASLGFKKAAIRFHDATTPRPR